MLVRFGMQNPDSGYRFRQNLPKKERLCSEKIIARLFQSGVFVTKYPLRVNALLEVQNPDVKVMFSVSKRRFSSAVDRNRIKRLLREVYRKDKMDLWEWAGQRGQQLSIVLIYTGNEMANYQMLQKLWGNLKISLIKKLENAVKVASDSDIVANSNKKQE